MALSPVTPADTAEIVPAPTDRACDTVSKFVLALTQWDAWINFAVNGDGTATQNFLDWVGTGAGTTAGQLNAPTGLTASSDRTADVTVSWGGVSGAVYYNVYRGESSDTNAMTLLVANQTGTSYADTSATVGVHYWYAVRAYSGTQISAMSSAATGVRVATGTPASQDFFFGAADDAQTFVVPAGYTTMRIRAFGAGGLGGQHPSSSGLTPILSPSEPFGGGGGGASGSYNHVSGIPVLANDVFKIVVGKRETTATSGTTYVYKDSVGSATFVSATGGGDGANGYGPQPGAGGSPGVVGSNTFGGSSVNEANRSAGVAGSAGASTWGGAGGTAGAALSIDGMSYGAGGAGSKYQGSVAAPQIKASPGYVKITLT